MISVAFQGRLGNNLFQMATAIHLANKLGVEFKLPKTTYAGHRGVIPVDLTMFDYKYTQHDNIEMSNQYNETEFHYVPIPEQDDLKLNGFFQSEKYFKESKDILIDKYFKPRVDISDYIKDIYTTGYDSLGICVRREDYMFLQHNHCVLDMKYYMDAINTHFKDFQGYYFIFSDDIEWCEKAFTGGNNIIHVKEPYDIQLFLMTQMDNLILANSTFSWFGGWLNQRAKKIIAPNPWFGPNYLNKDTKDLYPDNWIIQPHIIKYQI